MLATDQRGGNVVDPNQISRVNGDSIASPDVFRVELGNLNILDDDVLHPRDLQALSTDNTGRAGANDGLVVSDLDTRHTSLVIGNTSRGCRRLVVFAPVVLVDSELAGTASAPGSAAGFCGASLSTSKIKLLVEDNDTGLAIAKVRDQLVRCSRVDGSGAATTGHSGGETFCGTLDGISGDGSPEQGCENRCESKGGLHDAGGKENADTYALGGVGARQDEAKLQVIGLLKRMKLCRMKEMRRIGYRMRKSSVQP